MKKRIIALILCALMITAFTACGKDKASTDNAQNNTDASTENSTDASDAKDNTNETDNTKKEGNNNGTDTQKNNPDSARDTVLTKLQEGYEIISDIDNSKFYIFTKQDGEQYFYGIVDIDGNIAVEPTYTLMGWCDEHQVIYAEPFAEGDTPVVLDEKHRIDLHYGHGGWGFYQYLFEKSTGKFFRYYFNFDTVTVSEISEIDSLVPYAVYDGSEPIKPGEFALFDAVYDILSEIAFGDGGAQYEFITDKGGTAELGKCDGDYVYHFVNDYMFLRKNGKFGYVDGLGRESSEFIYDACTNAYDGKAWVLHEGVWKVIKLK